jgi:hypothetical protein
VSAHDLEKDLGIVCDAETVEVADKGRAFLQREILGRRSPFAALVCGRLEGFVDTRDLARRVADKVLARIS